MPQPRFLLCVLLLGPLWIQGALAHEGQDQASAARVQPSSPAPVSMSVNARALGIGEALFDYCVQNDPTGAARVRARLKELAQGASKESLAMARTSADYRSGHDSEAGFLSKIDAHNAHRVCSRGTARSK